MFHQGFTALDAALSISLGGTPSKGYRLRKAGPGLGDSILYFGDFVSLVKEEACHSQPTRFRNALDPGYAACISAV